MISMAQVIARLRWLKWGKAMIAELGRPHSATPARRCPQGGRAALGASTGTAVRRAGVAGGVAVAAPPVAVRRCRLAQPARKLTAVACAGVDVGTKLAAVDWASNPGLLVLFGAVFTCTCIFGNFAGKFVAQASRDGMIVGSQLSSALPSQRVLRGVSSASGCHSI
jgi:hypothetical protein